MGKGGAGRPLKCAPGSTSGLSVGRSPRCDARSVPRATRAVLSAEMGGGPAPSLAKVRAAHRGPASAPDQAPARGRVDRCPTGSRPPFSSRCSRGCDTTSAGSKRGSPSAWKRPKPDSAATSRTSVCQATLKTDPLATSKTDPEETAYVDPQRRFPWSMPTVTGRRRRSAAPFRIPAGRCVRRVVVDGRDAPSRPGRKAHKCHPSRGAGGVSPGGP